jgi:ribosomal protein S18 acetylase RimI-like enzyme
LASASFDIVNLRFGTLMVIRDAVLKDEANVVDLWRSCNLVASYNDPAADFRLAMAGCNSTLLLAEEGGRISGSVMVGHDGHRGWLYYVASSPGHRQQGTGRKIVEAGEQWLRDRNISKVQLMIRPTNATVVPFYERLGYENAPRILMSKWLKLPK